MKHCKILIAPNGERFLSIDDLREWVKTQENLERCARVMAQGIEKGAEPFQLMAKTIVFPAWESECAMMQTLEHLEQQMENCQCEGCKHRREQEAAEQRARSAHLN